MLKARKIEIITTPLNKEHPDDNIIWTMKGYEFENGVILIPCDTTNDFYYSSRSEVEVNATDYIVDILETDDYDTWTIEQLTESINRSKAEFGEESIPENVYDLLK